MADDFESFDFDEPGTGGGGNDLTGFSPTGLYSSPRVHTIDQSEVGGVGGESGDMASRGRAQGVPTFNQINQPKFGLSEYNALKQNILGPSSPSSSIAPAGGGGMSGGIRSGPEPEYYPGGSNPNPDYIPPEGVKNNDPSKGSTTGSSGGGGRTFKGPGPKKEVNPYAVTPNILPFQPVIPTPGSGMKRAFFSAQEDLLKAMAPYWLQQFK